ncbi:hypothetical protein J6590_044393 [Homalodisca vitripennis]|nr:hypothetical protein J6590_044393 [Homalodisca vitripennis]
MYRYLVLASMTNLLISCVIGLPSEVAEMPRKSPLDIVVEAKEGFGFNFVQRGLIKALNPKPIVDTITEEEKYGNTGENPLRRKVVKGVEGISNLVNSAFRSQTYKEDIDIEIFNEIKHLKSIHKTNLGDKSLQPLHLLKALRKTLLDKTAKYKIIESQKVRALWCNGSTFTRQVRDPGLSPGGVPEQALSQGSRKLTEILDNIGGRIVGLQK